LLQTRKTTKDPAPHLVIPNFAPPEVVRSTKDVQEALKKKLQAAFQNTSLAPASIQNMLHQSLPPLSNKSVVQLLTE